VIRKPIRINAICCVPDHVLALNKRLAPDLPPPKGSGHLAVVGGGPSVRLHLETLAHWPGDIWAINGACRWLRELGIETTFYTVCPGQPVPGQPYMEELAKGARKAVLSELCGPEVFAALPGAEISMLREPLPGPTSAVAASVAGPAAGYEHITFFGCEGSFEGVRCHAYDYAPHPHTIRLVCGEQAYLTKPEFLLQAETLAEIISCFPWTFAEQSGGLLRALIKHGQRYKVTHMSRALHASTVYIDEAAA
jgi:hypothetical protein